MSKILRKKAQHYVVQTYTSWIEPQYQTHIAKNPNELKEIAQNSEKVEAVYLLGKEISYAKRRNQNLGTFDGYKDSNERLVALL